MGLKSIILILHCIQICFTYPIDDNQRNSNEAEFSNHFSTSGANDQMMSFHHESIPTANLEYVNRQMSPEFELNANHAFTNFPDSIEPNTYIQHGGNRPFGVPNLPNPIPDDVEVFQPSGPSRPPRPYPPSGSYPPRPYPPRPIPTNPPHDPDAEVFSPDNGKPVPFPNSGILGSNTEILPVVFEREQFRIVPEHIERDVQILPGLMKNGGPVMIEKQNKIILPREQGQMTPMIVENEPGRIPPIIIERVNRPIMVESEHPQMTPFIENQRTLIVEQDYQKDPMSMVIEKESNYHPYMTPSMENKRLMVKSEQPEPESTQMIIEKETPFEKLIESPQMTHFTDNERDMGFEERNPTEFVPIPRQLPERMKRDKNSINRNDFETPESRLTALKENLIDEVERQSIADNEIMQNEGTLTISSNTKNETETTKVENIPTTSSQPLKIESNNILSTTNTSELKILEINHDASTSTTDEHNKHEQLSTEHISITSQLSNNKGDEKTTPISISNDKVEVENTNHLASADKVINHKGLKDVTQLTTYADEISTTSIPVDPPHQMSITDSSKVTTEKFINSLLKNETITNQDTNNTPHLINSTNDFHDEKELNFSTSITSQNKHPIPVVEPETIPQVQIKPSVYHIVDLTPINHQFLPPILPSISYIPPYPYPETQNFMDYGYGTSFGNINQYNYGVHALSQLYPSGHLDYYKSKL